MIARFKKYFGYNIFEGRSLDDAEEGDQEKKGGRNFHLGNAYEAHTMAWLHENTAASKNRSAAQRERYNQAVATRDESLKHFNPKERAEIKARAERSGRAYLESLKSEEGINPEDIHETYHTSQGIHSFLGRKVSRTGNPHDVVIGTKKGFYHGASLKFNTGTLSNNTANSYDEMMRRNGFKNANINGVWDRVKKKIGISGLTNSEIRDIKKKPSIVKANRQAQELAAAHHVDVFNGGNLKQQKNLLNEVMKATPDMPYHYVVGKTGTAENLEKKKQYKLFKDAKSLHAINAGGGKVHIVDHQGNHIVTVEHRPTHGSFLSIQANTKLGTGKPSNALPANFNKKVKK